MAPRSQPYSMLSTAEKDGLLNEDVVSDAGSSLRDASCHGCMRRMYRRLALILCINAILLAALTASCLVILFRPASASESTETSHAGDISEPYSPINNAIEYEYRQGAIDDKVFYGYPGPAWDQAIAELSSDTFFRISDEELALTGMTSLPLEGGGYGAGLAVGHNLHCIQKLKMVLYPDYFYPELNRSGPVWDYALDHADHCLDFLRQSMLCHVDYSVMTIHWSPEFPDNPTHNPQGLQKCVNWDKLKGWMKKRAVDRSMVLPASH